MSLTPQRQAIEHFQRAKRILVVTREHASHDALASVAACSLFLTKIGKAFDVVVPGFDKAEALGFLPGLDAVSGSVGAMRSARITLDVSRAPIGELSYDVRDGKLEMALVPKKGEWTAKDLVFSHGEDRYDLVLAVDTPDMASLGPLMRDHAAFLHRTTVVNVDRDPGNELWGQVNLVDLNAAATGEILFRLFQAWDRSHIDEDIATALLAGVIAKTRSFRTPDITPEALTSASELVSLGARREAIVHGLWRRRSVPTLKLWGRCLSRLEHDRDRGLVWSLLTRQDLAETGAADDALDDVVYELIGYAPEAKVILLASEPASPGPLRISIHTNAPFSAIDLGRPFDATGTPSHASFMMKETKDVIADMNAVVEKIRGAMRPSKA
ncbi:hypothetical protein KJ781_03180 [Patescibacteria group bacterium]|nr:hypothetical protein [Patescibacteria group bacterium]MBU1448329.1 hypothetical protein [Patescibacteria group bacterium]MBU2612863.1 hypothetical protein [Patescibacteria group bacterium]